MMLRKSVIFFVAACNIVTSCQYRRTTKCDNIYIDTTESLYVFYPNFKDIRLVCSEMPDKDNGKILFCCTAAFSKKYSFSTDHEEICGTHMENGKIYNGYQDAIINGGFYYHDGIWAFVHDSIRERMNAVKSKNKCGFSQIRLDTTVVSIPKTNILYDGMGLHLYKNLNGKMRLSMKKFHYRALCEKRKRLCIVESRNKVTLHKFRKLLQVYGVSHALYLDTGIGWNYSWYRDNNGFVQDLHPYIHPFITNWLVFTK